MPNNAAASVVLTLASAVTCMCRSLLNGGCNYNIQTNTQSSGSRCWCTGSDINAGDRDARDQAVASPKRQSGCSFGGTATRDSSRNERAAVHPHGEPCEPK